MPVNRAKNAIRIVVRPLHRFVIYYLSGLTETKEFKALYPILVIALAVLAALQEQNTRTLVVTIALLIIGAMATFSVILDTRKLHLEFRWNLLFFSYYRPAMFFLTSKIARTSDRAPRLDILTYRTSDLLAEIEVAAADFDQASGVDSVNLASFDIEYVPLLRNGVSVAGVEYKLVPLSQFWSNAKMNVDLRSFAGRIHEGIRDSLLRYIDKDHFYALPIGWGAVGIAIFGEAPGDTELRSLLTSETSAGLITLRMHTLPYFPSTTFDHTSW